VTVAPETLDDLVGSYTLAPGIEYRVTREGGHLFGERTGRGQQVNTSALGAMMWLQGYVEEFRVFGTDYPTPDGTAIRDYIHVCDLAQGHILALSKLLTQAVGGVFNLGSGLGYSVKEVLDEIAKTAGSKIPAMAGSRRHGDPAILLADPARARDHLGFAPANSQLSNIVATAWRWHQKAHPIKN